MTIQQTQVGERRRLASTWLLLIAAILLAVLAASGSLAEDPPAPGASATTGGGFYTRMKPKPAAEKPPEQYSGYVPSDGANPVVVPTPANPPARFIGAAEPAGPAVVAAPGAYTPSQVAGAPVSAGPAPQTAGPGPQAVERILERKLGSASFQQLLSTVAEARGADGRGSASASQYFDRAAPRMLAPADPVNPAPSTIFQRPQSAATYLGASQADAQAATTQYGGIPGGVVLEGLATFGTLDSLGYDARFNALVLNDTAVYLVKIPPADLAVMCRALAKDDRIGVSLGEVHQVYGGVPPDSNLALDMKIADHFLGQIVFAEDDWIHGYKLASGYKPLKNENNAGGNVAVFFTFDGFKFQVADGEIAASQVNLDVRLFPLSDKPGPDGSLQPDMERIAKGDLSPQYQANARHVAENLGYYRNEPIVDRMFDYGEVAAMLRGLKYRGFDLNELADQIG